MTRSAGTLALAEITISSKQRPNPPMPADSWGINIGAVTTFPEGLLVEVPPWGDDMDIGDSVNVRLNNQVMTSGFIGDNSQIGKPVPLFIESDRLTTGYFILDYTVTLPGTDPDPSPRTNVYIKLTRPGGRDMDPGTPGHSELHMVIPEDILLEGVDADTPFVPIEIKSPVAGMPAYPNIEEGDRIRLYWGSEKVEHIVTDEEAKDPDNHVIVIIVDKAVIDEEGDSEADGIPVAFDVLDVVNNRSEDWSTTIRIDVDTGSPRLTAPIIEEAFNNVLNMDTLPNPDTVTARVMAMNLVPGRTDFAPGDEIEIRLRGISLEGETVDRVYELKTVTSVPSIVDIPMPSIDVRLLVNTRAALSYRLVKADGSADLRSKSQFIEVIGEARQLAAPIAEDAIAGTLDPALPYTLIEIPWDESMTKGQVIDLKWLGTRGPQIYLPTLPLRPISDGEERDKESLHISVDGEHLRAIDGGTLELFYLLLRDTEAREVVSRQSLHADLLNIGEPVAELPPPDVEGEQDGVLDPADVPVGTRLIVRQYTDQIRGDEVHYVWNGSRTGIKIDSTLVTEINENEDIPFSIHFDLIKNNEGGTVKASYWVTRVTGRISPSEILPMYIGTPMDLAAPSVKQATGVSPNQQLNPVAAKDDLTVEIPNYGIQPGDQVRVTWAGTPGNGSHTTPLQALPGSREIPLPISLTAYNLDRSVTVTYTVTPSGGTESPPSAPLDLAVLDIPANELEPSQPRILEAANNGEGPELDVSNLTSDATVRIDSWPLIAQGQRIWLRLEGTKDNGSRYEKQWLGANNWVSAAWYQQGYGEVPIPYTDLQSLRDGSTLTVEFKASFDQSTDESHATPFPPRTYTIRVALDLPAPSVKQATGNAPSQQLNPVSAQDALTVEIPNYNVQPGDQVRVTWAGAPGDGSHTTPLQILLPEREIPLPISLTAYNLGRSVTVTYTVTPRSGSESEPSRALTLNVQTIPDISLPMPLIPQAAQGGIGSELDLSTFVGDTRVTVAPWPLIAAGQRVWLRVEGTAIDNSRYTITLYTAYEVVPSEVTAGLSTPLLRSELEKLRDGSALNVVLQVTFDQSSTQANAVDFPLRTYTLKAVALVAPTLTDITDSKGTVVGKITVETSVTVTGTGSSGRQIQLMDDTSNIGNPVDISAPGTTWSTPLTGLTAKDYSIKARPLYGSNLPDSAVKAFKVTATLTPTIVNIVDSKGSVVGGTTTETSVTVIGTGSLGQQIQLMDGNDAIGDPITISPNATGWTAPLTGLTTKAYNIKARALYGTNVPDSAVKTFNVITDVVPPRITNVGTATGAEVADGGVTDQVNVTLFGTALQNQTVEIFDENTFKDTADANRDGNWSLHQNGLAPGFHSFTAKGLYGNNPVSDARTFTVVEEWVIDFEDVSPTPIPVGTSIVVAGGAATITTLKDLGPTLPVKIVKETTVFEPEIINHALYISSDASVKIDLARAATYLRFGQWIYNFPCYVRLYDEQNEMIISIRFPDITGPVPSGQKGWFEYTATRPFKRIDLVDIRGGSVYDNFTLRP
ncbi:hypothetical protein [Pseudomonas sp. MWU12-2037]|uniref:hypothetical protein n=1 Tax=Pseudomonas sp. MWU12-2037 TaxID=2928690 RepID=UPI002010B27A|nr:hypothetical protein [Pseudomonas sp. MWU12-2037]